MKKINKIAWLVIAFASLAVGTWVWIDEGPEHSRFYMFYILAALCLLWVYRRTLFRAKRAKPKKRR